MKKGKSKKRKARPKGPSEVREARPAESQPAEAPLTASEEAPLTQPQPEDVSPAEIQPEEASSTESQPEDGSGAEALVEHNPMEELPEEPEGEPLPESSESAGEAPAEEAQLPEEEASTERAGRFRRIWSEELGGARQRAGRLWGRVRNKNYIRPQKGQVRQLIRRRFTYQELVGVFLALCPLVGVTASAADGLAAGLLSTLTLLGSVFILEILRRVLPDGIGSLGHMILVAGFTTGLTLALRAFMPLLVEELGIYLSMTVVSCLALERQVSPSQQQGSLFLLLDSVVTGLSFTLLLTVVSLLREFLGSGTAFGVSVLGGAAPLAIMAGPFGGFFCLGCVAALAQGLQPRRKTERRRSA